MSATRWDSYFDSTFAWTGPGSSLCYPGFLLYHMGSQGLMPQPWRLTPNRWLTTAYIYVVLQVWSPTSWDMCTATLCCELAAPALLAREGVACGLVWWGDHSGKPPGGACRGQIPTRPLSAWVPLVANGRWSLVPSTDISVALIERDQSSYVRMRWLFARP